MLSYLFILFCVYRKSMYIRMYVGVCSLLRFFVSNAQFILCVQYARICLYLCVYVCAHILLCFELYASVYYFHDNNNAN